jgi:hypothetical protein
MILPGMSALCISSQNANCSRSEIHIFYWSWINSKRRLHCADRRRKEPHLLGTCLRRHPKRRVRSSFSSPCALTFYAHCAKYVQLREALARNQEYIGTMNKEELRRAIEEPAQRGHWEIEPGLVDVLLRDVGQEPGALPLLSHALMETWQRRRGRTMTLGGYASSGGVHGAIAETAETVFTDQFTHEQQSIARRIFLRLTELGDETSAVDTRRRAKLDELILKPEESDITNAVLKSLADARLITLDENSAEVAHEALIREWPALQGWLEENREGLRLQRQLTEAAQEWLEMGRIRSALSRHTARAI